MRLPDNGYAHLFLREQQCRSVGQSLELFAFISQKKLMAVRLALWLVVILALAALFNANLSLHFQWR